ncbi:hypothetical protein [Enterococcus hirae]|uniref:hypothetical protein n=1 Tax=Enterococcus hirae TaxID=1354 RepID=UPI001963553A|nr:hypothetical protein [Enterococcus hirae]
MNRAEALRIGTVIANRWWRHNKPNILSQQHIDKQKAWQQIKSMATNKKRLRRQALSRKQNTSKEMLPHGKRTFHSRSIFN